MSNSSAHDKPPIPERSAEPPTEAAGHWWRRTLRRPAEAVGFWSAVLLPFVYLPLLVGGPSTAELQTVAGLIALHVVALWIGRSHKRTED